MIRGINRQDIFDAPEDYRKFIETLASLREVVSDDMQTKICTCHIYAYCIMPNHVHILIHEKDWTISYIHPNPVKAGLAKTAKEYCYSSWGNDYLGLADFHVCMTESVIRRYTLTELTAWVDMPMPEKYGCIDIDERRVIPDIEIRYAVIKACGLRSISDFQLLTLERRKSVIQEVMRSLDVRPRQLSRVTGMNYETIRNIAKKLP